ncbi:MAG: RNA polymerase sigma factor [Lachnospiraceae bacterium]|nr:RNA polymerase sigma factor [Lachnospiraceae bacterium]
MILLMMIDSPEDRRKFCILYEEYRYLMHKVAMDILHDCYLAEDAVHNAFMRVAHNMGNVAEPDSRQTKSYLIVITRNAAIDIFRKRKKQMQREITTDEIEEEKMPATYMKETDTENEILNILRNLPEKYKDIFLLKYSANMDNREIAKVCGIREGTVRQRLARGKVLIENELKKLEEDGYAVYGSNG